MRGGWRKCISAKTSGSANHFINLQLDDFHFDSTVNLAYLPHRPFLRERFRHGWKSYHVLFHKTDCCSGLQF